MRNLELEQACLLAVNAANGARLTERDVRDRLPSEWAGTSREEVRRALMSLKVTRQIIGACGRTVRQNTYTAIRVYKWEEDNA
jgi:hypothetical protein